MRGNGGTTPLFLNLGTRWSFTPHPFSPSPRKNARYPLSRRLGGPKRRSGDAGENSLPIAGNQVQILQSVAQLANICGNGYCLKPARYQFHILLPLRLNSGSTYYFLFNATTCPFWTSWSPLPVVAEV
jgi:hypothetical protein